jgi:hypothetical protein
MIQRIGRHTEACFICARRAGANAVGGARWAWFCNQCGVELARDAVNMTRERFDLIESAARARVASMIVDGVDGGDDVTIQRNDVELFVGWVIDEFSKQMREAVRAESKY